MKGTHKKGTASATGMKMKHQSGSGVRHGQHSKNHGPSANRKSVGGAGLTGPIKGRDKGGL